MRITIDEQCQFFLQDDEAKNDHDKDDMHTICQALYCKSLTHSCSFSAGPALEGTRCSMTDNRVGSHYIIQRLNLHICHLRYAMKVNV